MGGNLYTDLFHRLSTEATSICLETQAGERLTLGELDKRAAQLAHRLVASGVKVGDRVAVQVDKSVTALALYLATLRAGAVFLPLNTAYTVAELEYFISDAEPSLVVCRPDRVAALSDWASTVLSLDGDGGGSLTADIAALPAEFDTVERTGDDLAAILYTSGTTGRSKGAMLSHENLRSNAQTLVEFWGYTSEDRLIHALPIYHTHGLFVASNVCLLAGAEMLFLPGFDLERVITELPKSTSMMGVPTFYTRLLSDARLDKERCGKMRLFISGSAPLLAETHEAFEDRTGHRILERYGMTEINMATSNPLTGGRIAGTVGTPLPGVSLRIVDRETSAPVKAGDIGIIEIKGPNVFKGYWRMPEKTEAEFREDGFFITGDLGRLDENGYVVIVGRDKDLVITGGLNVYPVEVEAVLNDFDGVLESAVFGVPHADFGEAVVAVLVADPKANTQVDPALLLAQLSDTLAKFKCPKKAFMLSELPRNAMGKVQKAKLRADYAELFR